MLEVLVGTVGTGVGERRVAAISVEVPAGNGSGMAVAALVRGSVAIGGAVPAAGRVDSHM